MDERFKILVAKYVDNTLNESEKIEFENYLSDPECKEYLQDAENLEEILKEESRRIFIDHAAEAGVDIDDDDELMDEVLHDIREYEGKGNPEFIKLLQDAQLNLLKRRKRIRLFTYSTTLAAAIIAGLVLLFNFPQETTNEKIFKKYYKPYDLIVLRGEKNEPAKKDYEATDMYTLKNYKASTLSTLEAQRQQGDQVAGFIYGLKLMEMDSMQSAVEQFRVIMNPPIEKNGILYSKIKWYTALAYIYLGELDSALLELEEMKTGNEYFREDAVELIGVVEGIGEK